MNTEQARFNMIQQQIRPWQVLDGGVLDLLAIVKREDFVPETLRTLAFTDSEIPLPDGQCMLAPRVEARMLQALKLQHHEQVLEIGAGSGFMAALMAHKAQRVISLEISPTLAKLATDNLRRAAITNVQVRHEDGANGLASEGLFDAIVLSGSVADVPAALKDQLKVGGRLMAIVGDEPMMAAQLITRIAANEWQTATLFDTVAPRLQHFEEHSLFTF